MSVVGRVGCPSPEERQTHAPKPPPKTAPLDNNTGIATPLSSVDESTGEIKPVRDPLLKWQLQAVSRLALGSKHRLRICCRHVRPDWNEVQVRGRSDRRAYYAGLMACGLLWVCPVCAAKIQSVRAAEVRSGIDAWTTASGSVLLLTLTVPHTRRDDLSGLLSGFNDAYRRFTNGAPMKRLKQAYGLSGSIKGLEVTWGEASGWHPHAHVLLFLDKSPDMAGLAAALFTRWCSATSRSGFGELARSAFSLQDGSAVRTYVTKLGSEYTWGAEQELVKSHTKRGRAGERYTPFDFLRSYLDEPDNGRLLYLFGEFAATFKGRNQLVWSRGFKRSLLGSNGLTDQQVTDSIGEIDPVLARVTLDDWRRIRRAGLQGELLHIVQEFGQLGADNLLTSLR